MHRFLDEFEIQPDAARLPIAGTPLRFHLLHAPPGHLDTDDGFPFGDEGSNLLLESPPVPGRQDALALGGIAATSRAMVKRRTASSLTRNGAATRTRPAGG